MPTLYLSVGISLSVRLSPKILSGTFVIMIKNNLEINQEFVIIYERNSHFHFLKDVFDRDISTTHTGYLLPLRTRVPLS